VNGREPREYIAQGTCTTMEAMIKKLQRRFIGKVRVYSSQRKTENETSSNIINGNLHASIGKATSLV